MKLELLFSGIDGRNGEEFDEELYTTSAWSEKEFLELVKKRGFDAKVYHDPGKMLCGLRSSLSCFPSWTFSIPGKQATPSSDGGILSEYFDDIFPLR